MAVAVNTEELSEKGKSQNPETKHIPAGNRPCRLVSYVELGKHQPMFKGKPAVYESGKNKGKVKPPVFHCGMTFEFTSAEYTGDYPLTISTTRRMDNGEFFDAVTVPDSLMDGSISKSMAMRTKFMKYLTALQAATSKPWPSIADFAKANVPLIVNVTNKKGAARDDGTFPIYANMKPEGITSPKVEDPMTGEITDYSDKIVPAKGEYCTVYDWDAPTEDAWKALKPWDRDTIKAASNFAGSPTDLMLKSNPELDKVQDGEADGNPAQDDSMPPDPTRPGAVPDDDDIPV